MGSGELGIDFDCLSEFREVSEMKGLGTPVGPKMVSFEASFGLTIGFRLSTSGPLG